MKTTVRKRLCTAFFTFLVLLCELFPLLAQAQVPEKKGPTVVIRPNFIAVPHGTILLARKEKTYCAIRYIDYREDKKGLYARYESFYQGDGTGDFSIGNVEYLKGKVSNLGPRSLLGSHYRKGELEVKCGPLRLVFGGGPGGGGVHFFGTNQPQRDYGIELAPTPWKALSEVDVSDPRIVWYRFDSRRPDRVIPIRGLWPDKPSGGEEGSKDGAPKTGPAERDKD
jgi:hypothetical protein